MLFYFAYLHILGPGTGGTGTVKSNEMEDMRRDNNIRYDVFGVRIEPGNKDHCISFKDQVEGKPLAEVKYVESYKKYNADTSTQTGCSGCACRII